MKAGVDYPGVGIGIMVLRADGKCLIGRRGNAAGNEAGFWCFPGGKVDFMERLEDCAARECKEEFGIDVKVERLLKLGNHFIPKEKQHWVNPFYLARLVNGDARIMEPGKYSEFGWFSLSDLPKPLTVNTEEFFNDIKAGKIRIDLQ